MKKFTKGCLITALVLFVFGVAFWNICGYMGGFKQLDNMNLRHDRILSIGWNGLRFGWNPWFEWNGNWFDSWDDDFDDDWWQEKPDAPNLVEIGDKTQTGYEAAAITDIDIELGGCTLVIQKSDDDSIWIANDSAANTLKYSMKNGVFKLYYGKSVRFWKDISQNGNIYLYLPENMNLHSISLEMGAGKLESIALEADVIVMEAGAGVFSIEGLSGGSVEVQVGAGRADIGKVNANYVSVEADAGEVKIGNLITKELTLEVGMGNMDIDGSINEYADIECGMGNVNLTLQGKEEDYDYQIECAVGNINIGSSKYSGIAGERTINNGNGRIIDVECSAGNININFIK